MSACPKKTVAMLLLALGALGARADALSDAAAAIGRKDYAAAVQLLEPLAAGGDKRAQTRLGTLYHLGLGVREDDLVARQWFELAARQGFAPAQFELGNLYAFGHAPVPAGEDTQRLAAQWYFEAARQGHAQAQYSLGILFLAGSGVQRNPAEARKWIARAARQGHADAQAYLRAAPR
ncbi:MAG TPA: tetratricopeptide repeat protein [Burkholderiaceae bacterium]|nr:tetratricopeptide repeat protein [Burkholderiaceae bacterium]